MLDKSVYHIFGEDCARCMKITRLSKKSLRVLKMTLPHRAKPSAAIVGMTPALICILQFLTVNPSIMRIFDKVPV